VNGTLNVTDDSAADALLNSDGTALLIAMLLDQQVAIEWAFKGPATLRERLGHLDAATIATLDLDEFVTVCCTKPAIHRYPAVMGKRIHALCAALDDIYDGQGANLWSDVATGKELKRRLIALPGYGPEKTKIFTAILAKRFGIMPDGWQAVAGPFADDQPRSVADMGSTEMRQAVREWKFAQKAAGKSKQD
jgi:uncharacterized HhH-GPD family protein